MTSYTDRIFYSMQIKADKAMDGHPLIQSLSYKTDVFDFISDHAFVYGSFRLLDGKKQRKK